MVHFFVFSHPIMWKGFFLGTSKVNDESLRGLSCIFQVYSIISLIKLVYGNIRILTVR